MTTQTETKTATLTDEEILLELDAIAIAAANVKESLNKELDRIHKLAADCLAKYQPL